MLKTQKIVFLLFVLIFIDYGSCGMLDEIKHFFTEISSSIDNLLETVKNEALDNEDIQLVIKLIIVAITIHLIFSVIVLIYIGVSCYVMIYKQKVFSKDYVPNHQPSTSSRPYLKDMEISDKFLQKEKE